MAESPRGIKGFMQSKNLNISAKVYLQDAMGAMAFGLFSSLLLGTIFATVASWTQIEFFEKMAEYAKGVTGAAIGVAVAYSLKAPPLVLYTCAAVGMAGYNGNNPFGAYIAVLVACEIGKIISKETKLDIILTPTVTLAVGTGVSMWISPFFGKIMTYFGNLITDATALHPFWMGMAISVIVGMLLTLPISSAAICASLGIAGLAGGAAMAGCCAQMVGFAFMSFAENGWSGIVAQGLGTSMLQMPNIIKRPFIWLPPIIVSAITGPISTMIFALENEGVSAGMGTCGLVGPLGALTANPDGGFWMYLGILLVCFVLPAVLTPFVAVPFRKLDLIRDGDLLLEKGC